MGKVQSKVAPKPSPLLELGGAEIVAADNIPFVVAPPGTDQHLSARQPVLGVDSDLAVPRFLLHEKAKIGAEADILCLLLEHWDPLLRDEFDNLPIYYCSLYGHLRCCAWFLIAIGGTQNLPQNEIDRNIDNALHQGIKALFRGEQLPKDVITNEVQTRPQESHEVMEMLNKNDENDTLFGNLFGDDNS